MDAGGFDGVTGDFKLSKVAEPAEENAGEVFEGVNGSERSEIGGEGCGEVDDGDVAIEKGEGGECRKGGECGGGKGEVVGAVGETEGKEVAEGSGDVADGGVVERGLGAGVMGGWNVERL